MEYFRSRQLTNKNKAHFLKKLFAKHIQRSKNSISSDRILQNQLLKVYMTIYFDPNQNSVLHTIF